MSFDDEEELFVVRLIPSDEFIRARCSGYGVVEGVTGCIEVNEDDWSWT